MQLKNNNNNNNNNNNAQTEETTLHWDEKKMTSAVDSLPKMLI